MSSTIWRWSVILILLASGCQSPTTAVPTRLSAASTLPPTPTPEATNIVPPTWTAVPGSVLVSPTAGQLPSRTPRPLATPWPTVTPTPPATSTPTATPTETPTITPEPIGGNILPNPSFEEGWYHIDNIPELQVPNQWTLEWDAGYNPLDPDPWNQFVRPESRVLDGDFLPANEHSLFIWDGNYTVKIFKGQGALSYRLFTYVYLQPGSYLFEINVFPDLVVGYTVNGGKIWADDPLTGEIQFIVDRPDSLWILPRFGQRNTFTHVFNVPDGRLVKIGAAFRGRWAIENNGWFMDNWSLRRLPDSN